MSNCSFSGKKKQNFEGVLKHVRDSEEEAVPEN